MKNVDAVWEAFKAGKGKEGKTVSVRLIGKDEKGRPLFRFYSYHLEIANVSAYNKFGDPILRIRDPYLRYKGETLGLSVTTTRHVNSLRWRAVADMYGIWPFTPCSHEGDCVDDSEVASDCAEGKASDLTATTETVTDDVVVHTTARRGKNGKLRAINVKSKEEA